MDVKHKCVMLPSLEFTIEEEDQVMKYWRRRWFRRWCAEQIRIWWAKNILSYSWTWSSKKFKSNLSYSNMSLMLYLKRILLLNLSCYFLRVSTYQLNISTQVTQIKSWSCFAYFVLKFLCVVNSLLHLPLIIIYILMRS